MFNNNNNAAGSRLVLLSDPPNASSNNGTTGGKQKIIEECSGPTKLLVALLVEVCLGEAQMLRNHRERLFSVLIIPSVE